MLRALAWASVAALLAGCTAPPNPATETPAPARVAAIYFYWYRWPDEHFRAGRAEIDGHFHHFARPAAVDYTDPQWHAGEFADMARSGIDFALPVYWGVPAPHRSVGEPFADPGLDAMVTALRQRAANGQPRIRLGMFYDTTTLGADARLLAADAGDADLRTPAGSALFCGTVLRFFRRVPAAFWARIDGRPLVVLYDSRTATAWDESLGPRLRAAFRAEFGEDLFLVADQTWGNIGQDRTTRWGAAVHGPSLFPGIAQLGPGYDDSPVRGRITPSRDRENGNFYRWSWRRAVRSRPELVILETWNEMHEGSEICATRETGSTYLELTEHWVQRLHRQAPGPTIALQFRDPRPYRDSSWGQDAQDAAAVFADYTGAEPRRFGLREITSEEGMFRIQDASLRAAARRQHHATFLYFQIADAYRFDADQQFEVVVDATNAGDLRLQYDAATPGSSERPSRYRLAKIKSRVRQPQGTRYVFALPRARFANRQNGATDFRFWVRDPNTAILRVEVRESPAR